MQGKEGCLCHKKVNLQQMHRNDKVEKFNFLFCPLLSLYFA